MTSSSFFIGMKTRLQRGLRLVILGPDNCYCLFYRNEDSTSERIATLHRLPAAMRRPPSE